MTVSAATLAMLMEAGLAGDALLAVVRSIEVDNPPRVRTANAERQARFRAKRTSRNVTSNVTDNVTSGVTNNVISNVTPPPDGPLPSPQTPLPTPLNPPSSLRSESVTTDFSFEFEHHFWPVYPHQVGKQEARTAFERARLGKSTRGKPPRGPTDLDVIVSGTLRYAQNQPADRPWLNPATFLNGNRWEDSPGDIVPAKPKDGFGALAAKLKGRLENDRNKGTVIELDLEPATALFNAGPVQARSHRRDG